MLWQKILKFIVDEKRKNEMPLRLNMKKTQKNSASRRSLHQ